MRPLRTTAALALLLAGACSDSRAHARATCVLVDVSGTYGDQRQDVAHVIRTGILPKLHPGDTFFLVRVDGDSYGKENVEAMVTLDSQPSRANAQKLALAAKLDQFAATKKRSRYTDISGALMLAAEYLRETRAGTKTIVVFSDMKEELPPGAKRSFGPHELQGIDVVAMNVKRLQADKLDPGGYRKRLGGWGTRLAASGVASWKVVLEPEELVRELGGEY